MIMFALLIIFLIVFAAELERYLRNKRWTEHLSIKSWYSSPLCFIGIYNSLLRLVSPNKPFVSLSQFPYHTILEQNFSVIKAEVDALIAKKLSLKEFGEIEPLSKNISSDKWTSFFIKCYDDITTLSRTHTPKTAQLIDDCKSIQLAMFSILAPGAKIPPHFGPSKACYRYHLTIQCAPSNEAYIVVGGEKYHWKKGESVLFDDTYLHYVENPTDQIRVVLFCDVERKLSFPFNLLNKKLLNTAHESKHIKMMNKEADSLKE